MICVAKIPRVLFNYGYSLCLSILFLNYSTLVYGKRKELNLKTAVTFVLGFSDYIPLV